MDGINTTNVQAIQSLINTAQSAREATNILQRYTHLDELPKFCARVASVSDQVQAIIEAGQEIIKELHEMIFNTVMMIVGIASMFLGGWEGAAAAIATSTIQIFGDFGISGSVSAADFAGLALGLFAPIFDGLQIGERLSEIASALRITKTPEDEQSLGNFKYYNEVKQALSGVRCS